MKRLASNLNLGDFCLSRRSLVRYEFCSVGKPGNNMKKTNRKLVVNREAVRQLNKVELGDVAGGIVPDGTATTVLTYDQKQSILK
jgi:hypothetical protein